MSVAAPHVYADRCGVICQDLELPAHLDEHEAAWLVICPGRCVVLQTPRSGLTWTPDGVMTLAWRVAGRVPVVLDDVPTDLADALEGAFLRVLDWIGAAA